MAKEKRFEKVYSEGGLSSREIRVDTETGVQYFIFSAGYGLTMTPLIDAEGKPLLYRRTPNAPEY